MIVEITNGLLSVVLCLHERRNRFSAYSSLLLVLWKDVRKKVLLWHISFIPQYEASSDARFAAVEKLQKQYPNLRIAGNLRDGIGIGDRIKQGFDEAEILAAI